MGGEESMASDELPVLTSQKAAITPSVGLEDEDKVLEDNLDDPTRLTRLGRATIAQVGAITPTPRSVTPMARRGRATTAITFRAAPARLAHGGQTARCLEYRLCTHATGHSVRIVGGARNVEPNRYVSSDWLIPQRGLLL